MATPAWSRSAADGTIRWQTEFVGFDGSMPIWNFSGLSYWSVGYFRSEENMDVFASLRRGKLGSEVGFFARMALQRRNRLGIQGVSSCPRTAAAAVWAGIPALRGMWTATAWKRS